MRHASCRASAALAPAPAGGEGRGLDGRRRSRLPRSARTSRGESRAWMRSRSGANTPLLTGARPTGQAQCREQALEQAAGARLIEVDEVNAAVRARP